MATAWKVVGASYGSIWHRTGDPLLHYPGSTVVCPTGYGISAWANAYVAARWARYRTNGPPYGVVKIEYDPHDLIDNHSRPGQVRVRACRVTHDEIGYPAIDRMAKGGAATRPRRKRQPSRR